MFGKLYSVALVAGLLILGSNQLGAQSRAQCLNCEGGPDYTEFNTARDAYLSASEEFRQASRNAPSQSTPIQGGSPEHNRRVVERSRTLIEAYRRSGVIAKCYAMNAANPNRAAIPEVASDSACKSSENTVARLRTAMNEAQGYIAETEAATREKNAAEAEEARAQAQQEAQLARLKSQSAANEDFLARENAALAKRMKNQQTKSLTDFLADLGPGKAAGRAGVKPASSGGDFLSDLGPGASSATQSSASGDFLAGGGKGDFLADASDVGGHKIVKKGELQGVVDALGRSLIPMRKWTVVNYQAGIAEVQIKFDRYQCSGYDQTTIAAKSGFVGRDGEFIEKPSLKFFNYQEVGSFKFALTVSRYPTRARSRAEIEADKRRQNERRRAERQLKRQQCDRDTLAWKNRMLSRN